MNCLDSSFWIECFVAGPRGPEVKALLAKPEKIILPSICLVEVGRFLTREYGEARAQEAMGSMGRTTQVPLEGALAGEAVRLGLKHKLPLADSIIYATAIAMGATLWTLDRDFEGLPHVRYFSKMKG